MPAKQLTPAEKKQQEINLIVCKLPRNRAIEILVLNGHAKNEAQAEKLVNKLNGKNN